MHRLPHPDTMSRCSDQHRAPFTCLHLGRAANMPHLAPPGGFQPAQACPKPMNPGGWQHSSVLHYLRTSLEMPFLIPLRRLLSGLQLFFFSVQEPFILFLLSRRMKVPFTCFGFLKSAKSRCASSPAQEGDEAVLPTVTVPVSFVVAAGTPQVWSLLSFWAPWKLLVGLGLTLEVWAWIAQRNFVSY